MLTVELEQEADGRWIAEIRELPGVMCYGASREEALANVERLTLSVVEERTRVSLRLSVQRALLGAVPPSLRAVACGWNGDEIVLRFVFDGPISESDKEDMWAVGGEVIADFPAPATIREQIVRMDFPSKLEISTSLVWVYMRKEPSVR